MDRRRFLADSARLAAGAGALAVVGGALSGCGPDGKPAGRGGLGGSGPSITAPKRALSDEPLLASPAASSPIDHVVVVMMENRSFDHWLGWLATDHAWLEAGRSRYGKTFRVEADQRQTFAGPNGPVATRHWPGGRAAGDGFRGCGHPDPGHTWTQGRAQRDRGFLGTGSGNDEFALGYYEAADLPFTSALARRFTVCDHSHASLLASTYPNRMYLHSAQSGGIKGNQLPPAGGLPWDTIWDRLAKAGVSARYYSTDLPVTLLWGTRLLSINSQVDDYFADCKAGKLPAVTMVDPGFIGGSRTDDHPHGDVHAGERFLQDVFRAFAASPHWEHGLFVLTYDEWGGFFDHVRPATFADQRLSAEDSENFGQGGFRVPTVVASPYARRGYVDHTVFDHTSILRFIEWRFLGAPAEGAGHPGPGAASWALTERDTNANNIGVSLVRRRDAAVDFDVDAAIPASTAACAGAAEGLAWSPAVTGEVGGPQAVPIRSRTGSAGWTRAVPDHELALLATTGWLEREGLSFEPSTMATRWV
ncbi:MAG TPA: alkaline phosphatase family protein [Acidimicrobiales bacterium]|nr:alkaline phosphatase family protein [Acidimicrobiales bacterium]